MLCRVELQILIKAAMEKVKTILLNKGVYSDNDAEAEKLRRELKKDGEIGRAHV